MISSLRNFFGWVPKGFKYYAFSMSKKLTILIIGFVIITSMLGFFVWKKTQLSIPTTTTSQIEVSSFPRPGEKPAGGQGRVVISSILFQGQPQGGTIELFVFNTTVTATTASDEPIARVAERVAAAVNANASLEQQGIKAKVDSNRVTLDVAEYQLSVCTTDSGLDIPPKPQQLSCTVRTEDSTIIFSWKNPKGGYDRTHIVESAIPIVEKLPGTSTNYTHYYLDDSVLPDALIYAGLHRYRIVGVRKGIPCAATCEVTLSPL